MRRAWRRPIRKKSILWRIFTGLLNWKIISARKCARWEGAELADLDRISIRALSALRKVARTKDILLDITEDGVISPEERKDMREVLGNLEELEQITQSLKIWVKKNME